MENSSELINPSLEKKEFPTVLKICNVENLEELKNICAIGDSEEVEVGDYFLLRKNDNITTCSYGAGPCISGVLQTNDNKLYMFHSFADRFLTLEQKEIIKNTKKGIIGSGNKELLDTFKSEFKNGNIKVLPPPTGGNYDFNIVFVKAKNKYKVSPGIYFCHDNIENTDQQL
ncbi:MAG: hypothetical protein WCT51_03965 [Candidatus Shapirobacteria bacterium]|jgi:hypothetical protein